MKDTRLNTNMRSDMPANDNGLVSVRMMRLNRKTAL